MRGRGIWICSSIFDLKQYCWILRARNTQKGYKISLDGKKLVANASWLIDRLLLAKPGARICFFVLVYRIKFTSNQLTTLEIGALQSGGDSRSAVTLNTCKALQ
jgi:hypothetical protein